MEAREAGFTFLSNGFYEIPFFQRGYVWEEYNWKDFFDDLITTTNSHFMGSVIIRNIGAEDEARYSIIDGQQRLTTISILIRACYDTYIRHKKDLSEDDRELYMLELCPKIFRSKQDSQGKLQKRPIINHSMVDAPYYEKVVLSGLTEVEMNEIVLDSEMKKEKNQKRAAKSTDNSILKCYKYFYKRLGGDIVLCDRIRTLICNGEVKMIVKIELSENENEQAIFDTINTAGVRLSCADTIKNSLFQKAMELCKTDDQKKYVMETYKVTWEETFLKSESALTYWNSERQLGRFKRNNIELLLHSISLIKGFYDPEKYPLYKLPDRYKYYVEEIVSKAKEDEKLDVALSFVREIIKYANTYQKFFYSFDEGVSFTYKDSIKRLFHIMDVCGTTTFFPYVLKLLCDSNYQDDGDVPSELEQQITQLESYIVRSVICHDSLANFNKECPILLKGEKTVSDYLTDKDLSDERVKAGLLNVDNTTGKLILFWMELHRQANDSKADEKALFFSQYTLEHIMPQKWTDYWNIDIVPVVDVHTQKKIKDTQRAEEIRNNAVYEIGNMALLSGSLNSSISNYEFARKVNGDPKGKMKNKSGIREYASLTSTKEIVEVYDAKKQWNENVIRERTERMQNEVVSIWKGL